jgi:hypothetical protein
MTARTKTTSGTLVAYELRWNGGRSRRQFGHVTDDEFTELNRFSGRKDNTMRCISTSPNGSEYRAEINLCADSQRADLTRRWPGASTVIAGWQSRTNEDAQPGTTRRSRRPNHGSSC